jgi:hypothetical protein
MQRFLYFGFGRFWFSRIVVGEGRMRYFRAKPGDEDAIRRMPATGTSNPGAPDKPVTDNHPSSQGSDDRATGNVE